MIFNNSNDQWKNIGVVDGGYHWSEENEINLDFLPMFGIHYPGWGSCFGSDNLSFYKIVDDTIEHCFSITELSKLECDYGSILRAYGGEVVVNGNMERLKDSTISLNYHFTFTCYENGEYYKGCKLIDNIFFGFRSGRTSCDKKAADRNNKKC